MGVGRKPRHIVDYTQHGYIDFGLAEHGDAFAGVGQGNFLWSGDHYGARDAQCLHQREVDVARARGHVDEEVVELAPVGLLDELAQGGGGHRAAPEHSLVAVYQQPDGEEFDAVALDGDDEIAAVVALVHVQLLVFDVKHLGHRRAEYIGVEQSHAVALGSESHS